MILIEGFIYVFLLARKVEKNINIIYEGDEKSPKGEPFGLSR